MKKVFIALAVLCTAGIANAGLITVDFTGNDCAGVFGNDFEDCSLNGSPIIVKFDNESGEIEINSIFDSITGNEFDLDNGGAGDWSYDQGAGDPDIRYWVAKGGPVFRLHYVVEDANDAACAGSATVACLSLAQVVTGGSYSTPIDSNTGEPYDLSHLSFYDTAAVVPEPGTLLMFSLGLLGLGLARRRTV